jgi:hypothetical protein
MTVNTRRTGGAEGDKMDEKFGKWIGERLFLFGIGL